MCLKECKLFEIHMSISIYYSTEECVICLRPSPHTRLGSIKRYHSIDLTDFV